MTTELRTPPERCAPPPAASDARDATDARDEHAHAQRDLATSPPDRTIQSERTSRVAIGAGAIAAGAAAAGAAFLASRFLRRRDRRDQAVTPRAGKFQLGSLGAEAAVSLLDRAVDQQLRNAHGLAADAGRARNAGVALDRDAAPPSDGSAAHPHRGSAVADTRDGRTTHLDWSLWWTGRAWTVAIALDGEPYVDALALVDLYERLCARLSRASALVIRNEIARCATTNAKPRHPTIDV